VGYFKIRRYGNNFGIPNWCPKCGQTARELGYDGPTNQARRYMFVHMLVAH
jgi:hypothetical protein